MLSDAKIQNAPVRAPVIPVSVAIASSGLGHIRRGVEAWADDLAAAVRPLTWQCTLFQGAGPSQPPDRVTLPCWVRGGAKARIANAISSRMGGWRLGLLDAYSFEQRTFARSLLRAVSTEFDIVHVQDYEVAQLLQKAHRAGKSRAAVIYAPGTGVSPEQASQFDCVQFLSPAHRDDAAERGLLDAGQKAFTIPNSVPTGLFQPGDRNAARKQLGLAKDEMIVLCVAAIRRTHKRVDYVVDEFDAFRKAEGSPKATLVIAGAHEAETDSLMAEAKAKLGDNVRFFVDLPREQVPVLYQAADVFALGALNEVFGIVVLEAMATGIPVAAHASPTMKWIVGEHGKVADLNGPGQLAGMLSALVDPHVRAQLGEAGRQQTCARFSAEAVAAETVKMYREAIGR